MSQDGAGGSAFGAGYADCGWLPRRPIYLWWFLTAPVGDDGALFHYQETEAQKILGTCQDTQLYVWAIAASVLKMAGLSGYFVLTPDPGEGKETKPLTHW